MAGKTPTAQQVADILDNGTLGDAVDAGLIEIDNLTEEERKQPLS